jgi:hypothetical protein
MKMNLKRVRVQELSEPLVFLAFASLYLKVNWSPLFWCALDHFQEMLHSLGSGKKTEFLSVENSLL